MQEEKSFFFITSKRKRNFFLRLRYYSKIFIQSFNRDLLKPKYPTKFLFFFRILLDRHRNLIFIAKSIDALFMSVDPIPLEGASKYKKYIIISAAVRTLYF